MKQSFRRELFLCFVAVAIIPLLISCTFMLKALKSKLEYDYEQESNRTLLNLETSLTDYIADTTETIEAIQSDDLIINGIHETDSWLIKKSYTRLFDITETHRTYADYYVFDENGICIFSTSGNETMYSLPTYWGILKIAGTHPDDIIIRNSSFTKLSSAPAMNIAGAITRDDECVGYVLVSASQSHLEKLFAGAYSGESEIILLDEFWDEIFSSGQAAASDLGTLLKNRRISGEPIKQRGDAYLFYISNPRNTNLYIVLGKRNAFTDELNNTMLFVISIMAILALVLCIIMSNILTHFLTSPLKEITKAMDNIRQGDLTVSIPVTRHDEFGQLAIDFNDMTRALNVYVQQQRTHQQELNDSNIAMMQAQLNPHFLYNTLDTIKWVAKANHVPELATLSSSLAKILRASISGNTFITLAEEISLVTNYTDIQKIRFSDRFTFDAEVPTELEDAIIPKLILQPIVENAIVHGLKEQNEGHIFLNVYERNTHLIIEVEDDGCGMDEEMLNALNSHDRERLRGHIGFFNVDTIIRLHYGLLYGLKAENQETGGVRVTLELPINFE